VAATFGGKLFTGSVLMASAAPVVNSAVDGQLTENQFCCSKCAIHFYLLVLMSRRVLSLKQ